MKRFTFVFVLLFFFVYNLNAKHKSEKNTFEILFIGSSYFLHHDVPNLVYNLSLASGRDIYVDIEATGGMSLHEHSTDPDTDAKIRERKWDCVILQGSALMAYPEEFTTHPVYPSIVVLRNKIWSNHSHTRVVYSMPWGFEDGMTWYNGWSDTYVDMQLKIYDKTIQYSEEIGFEIAPTGWVWYAVLDYFNYPLHFLHTTDWSHATLEGAYLMACTLYSTLFQESTIANSYHEGINEKTALYFQTFASDTVLNNIEQWNIQPFYLDISEYENNNDEVDLRTYPNPFHSFTTLNYFIKENSEISIIIFDLSGKKVKTLIQDKKQKGRCTIRWSGDDEKGNKVNSGLYLINLSINQVVSFTKPIMVL